jgi:mannitol operon repressor
MTSNNDEGRILFMSAGNNPDTKEFTDFLGEFNKESDRGAVLSSTAYIDFLLRESIKSLLIDNTSAKDLVDESLGTFSARIASCHAMGLISDIEREDCNLLRHVRNRFAHHAMMSFADSKIESWCMGLKLVTKPPNSPAPNTRMRFQSSAIALITRFMKRPKQVEAYRLKAQSF